MAGPYSTGPYHICRKNLDDFYVNYINGLTAIDYNKYLGYAGYKTTDQLAENDMPTLGITQIPNIPRTIITTVLRGSAAWICGINVNDEIVAIDDIPVPETGSPIAGKKVGDKIQVTVIRDGLTLTIPVTLLRDPKVKHKIDELPNPTAQQLVVRKKWLSLQ